MDNVLVTYEVITGLKEETVEGKFFANVFEDKEEAIKFAKGEQNNPTIQTVSLVEVESKHTKIEF